MISYMINNTFILVGATDLGPVDLTVQRHKIKIEATELGEQETKIFKASTGRSIGSRANLEEPYIVKNEASLDGQASPAGARPPPEGEDQGRACRDSRRSDYLTDYSTTTHIINQCGVKPQDD